MLRARDVMTKDVIWLNMNKNLDAAYRFMCDYGFRHLPIVDDDHKLIGIISEGDILKSSKALGPRLVLPNMTLEAVMSKDVITCTPNCFLGNVVATMMACKINSVPVVSRDSLLGIITTTDVLDVYCRNEEENGHTFMPIDFVERKHALHG